MISPSTFRNASIVLSFLFLCSSGASAQSKTPQKTYMYLIYHKLNPGLTIQDALPVEREWKKVNQAAVDEGKLEGWYMTVKQFTSNPNQTEYDYVTRIVTHEMAIKGASPEAMARIYGDSVQQKMADLQRRDRNTAPVVKIEIWEINDGTYAPKFAPDGTQLMVIDRIRRRNPGADYEGTVGQLKRLSEERIKRNNLLGWDFSSLIIPNGSEKGYEFSIAQYVSNLGAVANPVLADTPNPVMPAPAYKQLRNQTAQVFDFVRQEVYRFMEYTTKPAN
ncbi:hypothetical protein EXU85_14950 [Spirosoma sp. KCTC 42546]|uniref:hypothetical protein n=1 Tax=Spirosoma sp. KCTC 42546 TaxID=2520506 RepID=UPI00115A3756|nr:hypothetical protein [Spirosoma sp. KCTC 42546]QDK79838.1 hypothetical protein EXU85_14950 [Spirosoma sp. KCTC 42546]